MSDDTSGRRSRSPARLFRLPWRTARRIRDDFEDELTFHYEMRVAELVAQGVALADAGRIAGGESGDVDEARRYVRAVDGATEAAQRRRNRMQSLAQEFAHAMRRLRRAPSFALTAVLTLALGIGACTLMLAIVSAVLLRPLPFKNPDRVAMVWGFMPQVDLGYPELPVHGMYFTTIRDNAGVFEDVAAFRAKPFNLGATATPERLDGIEATGEFFAAVGVSPAVGRVFSRADETAGSDRVVVISDALWQRRFSADRRIIGRTIDLNGEPYTVIGVAPPGFAFPRGPEMPPAFQLPAASDLWVPLLPPKRGPSDLAIIARLRDGVTLEAAQRELDRTATIQERLVPGTKSAWGTRVVSLRTQLVGRIEPMLVSLLAGVGLLLILACVNTAQLEVAHLQRRRRELAIRSALGASDGRLTAGLVADVLLVALSAGGLGAVLAWGALVLVRAAGASHLPRLAEASFDLPMASVSFAVTLVAALLAGMIPAWFGARVPVVEVLRSGGRGLAGSSSSARARRALIVAEVALSSVLVASAGLLARSLARQLRSATGFSAPNGVTFEVTLPPVRYAEQRFRTYMEHPAAVAFFSAALERIRAIPGVQSAAIGKPLPLSGAQEATVFIAEGAPAPATPAETPIAEYTVASSQMFSALGTPMLAGRDFASSDIETAPPVVIVNQSMATWLWPGESAVGKRIHLGTYAMSPPWMTVIGVVADLKRYSLTESPRPEMIVPYTQKPYPSFSTMQFVVRSTLPAARLLAPLRAAVTEIDGSIPVSRVRTIDDLVAETSANARFATRFMTAFGASALLLAMVGLYGVIAYSVHQRRQEFGVRRALGAAPREIVGQVLIEGARLAVVGIGLGTLLSVFAGRAIRQLLYGVSDHDPVTLVATLGLLAVATLTACVAPAWRASRVEPRVALEDG